MKIRIIDYGDFDSYGKLVGKDFEVLDTVTRYKVVDDTDDVHWINSTHCRKATYKCKTCGSETFLTIYSPQNNVVETIICKECGKIFNKEEDIV